MPRLYRRTPSTIEILYERQDGRCAYTFERMILHPHDSNNPMAATKDHVLPRSRGGASDLWNLVACTREANCRKGSLLLRDFLILTEGSDWRSHPMAKHPAIRQEPRPQKKKSIWYQIQLDLV